MRLPPLRPDTYPRTHTHTHTHTYTCTHTVSKESIGIAVDFIIVSIIDSEKKGIGVKIWDERATLTHR